MMRVTHPRLPSIGREVPDADVDRWVAQGWIAAEPVVKVTEPPRKRKSQHPRAGQDTEGAHP